MADFLNTFQLQLQRFQLEKWEAPKLWELTGYIFLGFLILLAFDAIRSALRPGLRGLPGPAFARWTRLYRFFLFADGDGPRKLLRLHKTYGPIVRVGPNHVYISDPKALPIVYPYSGRYAKSDFYKAMAGRYEGKTLDNLFTQQDSEAHKRLKVPVSQKFSASALRALEPMFHDCIDVFFDAMDDLAGQKIDLSTWLQWFTFDAIAQLTFQRRFGFMEERKDVRNLIPATEGVVTYGALVGLIPELHRLLLGNDVTTAILGWLMPSANAIGYIFQITGEEMKRYDVEGGKDRADLLAWLKGEMNKGNTDLGPRELFTHISSNLLAGSDTTAVALRAVFYHLIKNPNKYLKLQQEIDDAQAKGQLSEYIAFEESQKLEYFQAVVKEAMRLNPSIVLPFERVVPPTGDTICGVNLPGGTIVAMDTVVVHRDKATFGDDVESFRPERWIDSDPEQIKAMERAFFTFGYGTRTCMGKNIALMEIGKVVPQTLRRYTLEWASDEPEWRVTSYWFGKQEGVIVKFRRR